MSIQREQKSAPTKNGVAHMNTNKKTSIAASSKRDRGAIVERKTASSSFGANETFIDAWRTRGHWWRIRAIVSLFLAALLFSMMPGTGTTLYQNWAFADDGENLVAATADLSVSSQDLIAQVQQYTTEKYTDPKSGITGDWDGALDGGAGAFRFLDIGSEGKVIYYPSVSYAPKMLWARNAGSTATGEDGELSVFNANIGVGYLDMYGSGGVVTDSPSSIVEGRGQYGMIGNAPGKTEIPIPLEDTTGSYTGKPVVEIPWWAVGYEPDYKWYMFDPDYAIKPLSGRQIGYLDWGSGADASNGVQVALFSSAYTAIAPHKDSSGNPISAGGLSQYVAKTSSASTTARDILAFASWVPRTYHVVLQMDVDFGSDGSRWTVFDSSSWSAASDTAVNWLTEFPVSFQDGGQSFLAYELDEEWWTGDPWSLEASMDLSDVWWRSKDASGNYTNNGFHGSTGTLWELVNKDEDAESASDIDPYYENGTFYGTDSENTVYAEPFFAVSYDSNGGSGGLRQWAKIGLASAESSSGPWVSYYAADGTRNTEWDDESDYYKAMGYLPNNDGRSVLTQADANVTRDSVEDESTGTTTSYTFKGWTVDTPVADMTSEAFATWKDSTGGVKFIESGSESSAAAPSSDGLLDHSITYYAVWVVDSVSDEATVNVTANGGTIAGRSSFTATNVPATASLNSLKFTVDGSTVSYSDDGTALDSLTKQRTGDQTAAASYAGTWTYPTKTGTATGATINSDISPLVKGETYNLEYNFPFDVTVNVTDGTLGGKTALTVTNVPYGTALGDIKFNLPSGGTVGNVNNQNTTSASVAYDADGATSLDDLTKTPGDNKGDGSWSWTATGTSAAGSGESLPTSEDEDAATLTGAATLTYTFGSASHTVTVDATKSGGKLYLTDDSVESGYTKIVISGVPYETDVDSISFNVTGTADSGNTANATYDEAGVHTLGEAGMQKDDGNRGTADGQWTVKGETDAVGSTLQGIVTDEGTKILGDTTIDFVYMVKVNYKLGNEKDALSGIAYLSLSEKTDKLVTEVPYGTKKISAVADVNASAGTITPKVTPTLLDGENEAALTGNLATALSTLDLKWTASMKGEDGEDAAVAATADGIAADITREMTFTGALQYNTCDVSIQVVGGTFTLANVVTTATDNAKVGTVEWGDQANTLVTGLTLNPSNNYEGDGKWDPADPRDNSTIVTGDTTYKLEYTPKGCTVEISVTGGTIGGKSSITVTGVPYNTTLENVKVTAANNMLGEGTSFAYDPDGTPVTSLTEDPTTPNYTSPATWDVAKTTAIKDTTDATPVGVTFAGAKYTVTVNIVNGTVNDGTNDVDSITITGVPAGTSYSGIWFTNTATPFDYKTQAEAASVATKKQLSTLTYKSDNNGTTGTWSLDGGTTAAGASAAPTALNGLTTVTGDTTITFTFDAGNVTVNYVLQNNASDTNPSSLTLSKTSDTLTYGSDKSAVSALTMPTLSLSGDDAKKYETTLTWGDPAYSNNDDTVTGDVTITGTVQLKTYTVTYRVMDGGTWSDQPNNNAELSVNNVYYNKKATDAPSWSGSTAAQWVPGAIESATPPSGGTYGAGHWTKRTGTEGNYSYSLLNGSTVEDELITEDTVFEYRWDEQVKVTFKADGSTSTGYTVERTLTNSGSGYTLSRSQIPSSDLYTPASRDYYGATASVTSGKWVSEDGDAPDVNTGTGDITFTSNATYKWVYDRYYPVTFSIVGGTWSSTAGDSATKTEYVKAGDTIASVVPDIASAVVDADSGYETGGSWSPTLDTTTKVESLTGDRAYTYTFNAKTMDYYVTPYILDFANDDQTTVKSDTLAANYTAGTPIKLSESPVSVGTEVKLSTADEAKVGTALGAGYTVNTTLSDAVNSTLTITYAESDSATNPANTFKVYLTRKTATLSFQWYGGTGETSDDDQVPSSVLPTGGTKFVGAKYTVPTPDAASGYTFVGWKSGSSTGSAVAVGDYTMPTTGENVSLYGVWTRATATVKFVNDSTDYKLAGQETAAEGYTVTLTPFVGESYTAPTAATGQSARLVWSDLEGNTVTPAQPAASGETTYYAKWVVPITVTYESDGNTENFPTKTYTFSETTDVIPGLGGTQPVPEDGESLKDPSAYAAKGYHWLKWSEAAGVDSPNLIADPTTDTPYPHKDGSSATASGDTNLVFTANYAANVHPVTWAGDYPSGTSPTVVWAKPADRVDSAVTDGEIYLPKANELTVTGYTLQYYNVFETGDGAVGAADYTGIGSSDAPVKYEPGSKITVKPGRATAASGVEGDTGNYTTRVSITAVFARDTVTLTYAHNVPNASETVPALTTTQQGGLVTSAGTGDVVSLPNVSNENIPGHSFAGWTVTAANGKTVAFANDTKATDVAPQITMPSESTSLTVTANWTPYDNYTVTWNLASDYTEENGFALNRENATTTTSYNTSLTAPTANWTAGKDAALGYTTDIKWYTTADDAAARTNEVDLSSAKVGIAGTLLAGDSNRAITLIGVPQIKKTFKVRVEVDGGKFKLSSAEDEAERVSYTFENLAYGTDVKTLLENLVFAADEGNSSVGTWTLNGDPSVGPKGESFTDKAGQDGLEMLTYRLSYPKKSYKVVYKLADGVTDVTLSSEGTTAYLNDTVTVPAGVKLAKKDGSALDSEGKIAYKYSGISSWAVEGSDSVVFGSTKYTDDIATASESGGEKDTVTLVATPAYVPYTLSIEVSGGTVKDGESGTPASSAVITNNAHYGDAVNDYFTDGHSYVFEVDEGVAVEPYEWGATGNPELTLENGGVTVSNTAANNVFTRTYKPLRTVTFTAANGKFDSDSTPVASGDVKSVTLSEDGKTLTYKVADGGTLAAPTAAALPGHEGTLAWSLAGSETKVNPGDEIAITANADYSFQFEAKTITYTVVRHYQNLNAVAGTYNAENYTEIESSTGSALFGTTINPSDTDKVGFVKAPVAVKNYSGAVVENITLVEPTNPTGEDPTAPNILNLYYDRVMVDYSYNLANIPAGSGKVQPASGSVRYGTELTLVQPGDATSHMFEGWWPKLNTGKTADTVDTYLLTDANDHVTFTNGNPNSITFYGQYVAGKWAVTFKLDAEYYGRELASGETATYANGADGGATYVVGLEATEDHRVEYGKKVTQYEPKVTFSNDAKYEVVGYKYAINGTLQQDGKVVQLDDVPILGAGYTFYPVFDLRTYDVTYTAGKYGYYGDPDESKVITYKQKYGELVRTPTIDELFGNKEKGIAGIGSDDFGGPTRFDSGDALKYALNNTNYSNGGWQWTTSWNNLGSKAPTDQAVDGPITFEYRWEPRSFHIYFIDPTQEGTGAIDEKLGVNSTDKRVVGYAATNYGTHETPSTVRFYDNSVFKITGQPIAGTYAWSKSGGIGVDALKSPTKAGYAFAGYSIGTNVSPGAKVTNAAGEDILVSTAAAGQTLYESRQSENFLFLWQNWEGAPAQITFHSNEDGKNDSVTPVVQDGFSVGATPELKTSKSMGITRTGYTFAGWYTDRSTSVEAADLIADGSTSYQVKGEGTTATANNNDLFARWTENTYPVRWMTFDGAYITYRDVYDTYKDSTDEALKAIADAISEEERTSTEPYEQVLSYSKGGSLRKMKAVVEALDASSGKRQLTTWALGSDDYNDGAAVLNNKPLTEGTAAVTLSPQSATLVSLTYQDGVGTGTGTVTWPAGYTTVAARTVTAAKSGNFAEFKLIAAPTRAGYTFTGWKIGTTTTEAGGDVALRAVENTAVAQWTPITDTTSPTSGAPHYAVEVYVEDENAEGGYKKVEAAGYNVNAVADTTVEVDTSKVEFTGAEGYELNEGASDTAVTVDADSGSKAKLYYDKKTFTITYEYVTPEGEETDAVLGIEPQTVKYGNTATTAVGPETENNLPDHYKFDTAQGEEGADSGKWLVKGSTPAVYIVRGQGLANVTGDVTLQLPIELESHTVTYAAGDNARLITGSSDAVETVKHGKTPDVAVSHGKSEAVGEGAYEFSSWTSEKSESQGGTIVEPKTTPVTGDVTYYVNYKKTYTVVYSPGDHASPAFGATFDNLPGDFEWTGHVYDSATEGSYNSPTLVLSDADADGNPKAATGYAFDGWDDYTMGSGETEYTLAKGSHYATLTDLYASAPTTVNHRIVATWKPVERTITFIPGEKAASGAANVDVKADTGAEFTAPAAPSAQAGFAFAGWAGTLGGVDTVLQPGEKYTMHAADTAEFTGTWKPATVDLTFKTDDVLKGKVAPTSYADISVTSSDEYFSIAKPLPGYKFVKWTVKAGDAAEADVANTEKSGEPWYDGSVSSKTDGEYGYLTVLPQGGYYREATYTAYFEADPYTVTFDFGDGAVVDDNKDGSSIQVQRGQNAVKSAATDAAGKVTLTLADDSTLAYANKTGYQLVGWSYSMDVEQSNLKTKTTASTGSVDPASVAIMGNTTFTAVYSYDEASVKFDGNGATGGNQASLNTLTEEDGVKRSTHVGDTVTLPEHTFTKTGATFVGWSLNKDAQPGSDAIIPELGELTLEAAADQEANPSNVTTVYAIWEAGSVSVEYIRNGGTSSEPANVVDTTGTYGSDVEVLDNMFEAPSRLYEFDKWSTNATGVNPIATYAPGEKIPAADVTEKADAGENYQLYALWKDKKFTVTYSNGVDSSDTTMSKYNRTLDGEGDKAAIGNGTILTIMKNEYERPGWYFNGWDVVWTDLEGKTAIQRVGGADSANKNVDINFTGAGDVTVTATWKRVEDAEKIDDQGKIVLNLYDQKGDPIRNIAQQAPSDEIKWNALQDVADKDHYTFMGWYASSSLAQGLQASNRIGGEDSGLDKLKDVLKTYYATESHLSSVTTYYWDTEADDYTDDYKNATRVTIPVYMGATLDAYEVSFLPWYPGTDKGDAPAVKLDDQRIYTNTPTTLQKNADEDGKPVYAVDGYRFLGWQTATATGAKPDYTAQQYEQLNPHYVDGYQTRNGNLVTVPGGLKNPSITLYGAWALIDNNSVQFVSRYEGDGLAEADTLEILGSRTGISYDSKITLPDLSEDQTLKAGDPYSDKRPDIVFEGWYTERNAVDSNPELGTRVDLGADTVSAVANAAKLSAATDGHYDIVLYARWTTSGASVTYDKNGAIDEPATAMSVGPWSEETGASIKLIKNTLTKPGYYANGWNTEANPTADQLANNGGTWHYGDEDTYTFTDKQSQTIYAEFLPKTYKVNYVVDTLAGYSGTSSAAPAAATGLKWDVADNTVISPVVANSKPTKDGYKFMGWYVTNPQEDDKAQKVEDEWTVEDLQTALAEATGTDLDDGSKTTEGDNDVYVYAKWSPATFLLQYQTDGGTYANGSTPEAKGGIEYSWSTTAEGEKLVFNLDGSDGLTKAGYTDGTWYVDADRKVPLVLSGNNASMSSIIKQWRNIDGNGNVSLPGSFTLYAGWTERTVNITFKADDNGKLNDQGATNIVYRVGVKTGTLYDAAGKAVTTGDESAPVVEKLSAVTASAVPGYQVTGWKNKDNVTVTSEAALTVTPAASGLYEANTYTAIIEPISGVSYTVNYFVQGVDGTWYVDPTATIGVTDGTTGDDLSASALTSAAFFTAHGGVPSALSTYYDGVDASSESYNPVGLYVDTARTPAGTLSSASTDTVVNVYYNRSAYEVVFASAWEGETGNAVPKGVVSPQLPSLDNQYYGADVSTMFYGASSEPTAPDGYEFIGWYMGGKTISYADLNEDGTSKVEGVSKLSGDTFTMPANANPVVITGVFKKTNYNLAVGDSVFKIDGTAISDSSTTVEVDQAYAAGVTVNRGVTLADAGYKVVLQDTSSDAADPVTLGSEDKSAPVLATVKYNRASSISWRYKPNASSDFEFASDPTTVPATALSTSFEVVVEENPSVTYQPGERGNFALGRKTEGVSKPISFTDGAGTLFGAVVGSEGLDATGLPKAKAGYQFAYWDYQYLNESGVPETGSTADAAKAATGADKVTAGLSSLTNVNRSIVFTAVYEPAPVDLTLDPGTVPLSDELATQAAPNWGSNPQIIKTYKTGDIVEVPNAEYVTRTGFELSKWQLVLDGKTYQFTPGQGQFVMPGTGATLTALWTEVTNTYTYESTDVAMGTVSLVSDTTGASSVSETVGYYTGEIRGATAAVTDSNRYEFVEWNSSGASVPDTVATVSGEKGETLTPKRGGSVASTVNRFTAVFRGATKSVAISNPNTSYGTVTYTPAGSTAPIEVGTATNPTYTTSVAYGGSLDGKLAAKAADGYTFEGWSYVMNKGNSSSSEVVQTGTIDATSDPTELMLVGSTSFTPIFTSNAPAGYAVNYYMDSEKDTLAANAKTRLWTETVLGGLSNPSKTGYDFKGWKTVVDKATKDVSASATVGEILGSSTATALDVYGTWAPKEGYTLYFDAGEGSFEGSAKTAQVTDLTWETAVKAGTTAGPATIVTPTRTGYDFVGWFTQPGEGGTEYITSKGKALADGTKYSDIAGENDDLNATFTLYAHWTEREYTVNYISTDWITYTETTDPAAKAAYLVGSEKFTYTADGLDEKDALPDMTDASGKHWWRSWYYPNLANEEGAKSEKLVVDEGTSVIDLDFHARNSDITNDVDADGAFYLYTDWGDYVTWTTTYVPYDMDSGSWDKTDFTDERVLSHLTVKKEGKEGDVVRPYLFDGTQDYTVPGYVFGDDAKALMENPTTNIANPGIVDFETQLKATLETGIDPDFEVVVTAKPNFFRTVYDMNTDNTEYPGGELKAYPAEYDESDPDSRETYAADEGKDYGSVSNIPSYHSDHNDEEEDYLPPVRKGFTFDGWFNQKLDDGDEVTPYNSEGGDSDITNPVMLTPGNEDSDGYLYGELTFDEDGNWIEPEDGTLTLFAKWTEQQFEVTYAVADDEDSRNGGTISYIDAEKWGTDELPDTVGAASGKGAKGVVAKANPGYHFTGWKVVSNVGKMTPVAASSVVPAAVQSIGMATAGIVPATGMAALDATAMTAQAADDTYDYSSSAAIMPGYGSIYHLFGADPEADEHVTYMATFAKSDYTIAYDANYTDAEKIETTTSVEWDQAGLLGSVATPERDGYDFLGWFTAKTGGTQVTDKTKYNDDDLTGVKAMLDGEKVGLDTHGATLTLYAQWQKSEYTVTIDDSGITGGTVTGAGTYTVEHGKTVPTDKVKATPDTGYQLEGWLVNGVLNTETDLSKIDITDDVTLKPQFTKQKYQVTVDGSGLTGGTVTGANTYTVEYGSGVPAGVTATPAAGYKLDGWLVNGTLNTQTDASKITITGATILKPQFSKQTYQVTIDTAGVTGGTVAGAGTYTIEHGATVPTDKVKATPATGYKLDGWLVNGVLTSETDLSKIPVTANTTLKPQFSKQSYQVTVDGSGVTGGTVTGAGTYPVEYGSGVPAGVTATPAAGYKLDGWLVNGTLNTQTDASKIAITGATTLKPQFSRQSYQVRVDGSGLTGGTVTGASTYTVAHGSGVPASVKANPATGYKLDGWLVNGTLNTQTDASKIAITAATTLKPQFSKQKYSVTVDATGVTGGTVAGAGTYTVEYGAGVPSSVTATPAQGYKLDGWLVNGTLNTQTDPSKISVTGITTLKPRFSKAEETQVMYRLYNPNSGEHFYTADVEERDALDRIGWNYEGIGWVAPKESGTPVYRAYSGTDHHYTTDWEEIQFIVRAGWKYEGIGWYSDDEERVPLYREYNPNVNPKARRNNSGSHNYTVDIDEHNFLGSIGWHLEGIGWYAVSEK